MHLPLSDQHVCFCSSYGACGGGEPSSAWAYISEGGIVTGGQSQSVGPFAETGLCSTYSLPHCHHHGPTGNDPFPAAGNKTGCPAVVRAPSCPSTCDSTAKAPHANFRGDKYGFKGKTVTYFTDADTIAEAIMLGGPVEASFEVFDDFANYVSGIYHFVSGVSHGGHSVKIVGWGLENGTKYWKVANSWNKYWGESGFFRIMRGSNECGIEKAIIASART
jgi:cathepsin B